MQQRQKLLLTVNDAYFFLF